MARVEPRSATLSKPLEQTVESGAHVCVERDGPSRAREGRARGRGPTHRIESSAGLFEGVLEGLAVLEDLARLQLAVEDALDERPRSVAAETVRRLGRHHRVHLHLLEQRFPHLEQAAGSRSSARVPVVVMRRKGTKKETSAGAVSMAPHFACKKTAPDWSPADTRVQLGANHASGHPGLDGDVITSRRHWSRRRVRLFRGCLGWYSEVEKRRRRTLQVPLMAVSWPKANQEGNNVGRGTA